MRWHRPWHAPQREEGGSLQELFCGKSGGGQLAGLVCGIQWVQEVPWLLVAQTLSTAVHLRTAPFTHIAAVLHPVSTTRTSTAWDDQHICYDQPWGLLVKSANENCGERNLNTAKHNLTMMCDLHNTSYTTISRTGV